MNTTSSSRGGVKTTARTFPCRGATRKAVFREINHGYGVSIYDIELDGKLIPRLDQDLYGKIMKMDSEQLGHYFADAH